MPPFVIEKGVCGCCGDCGIMDWCCCWCIIFPFTIVCGEISSLLVRFLTPFPLPLTEFRCIAFSSCFFRAEVEDLRCLVEEEEGRMTPGRWLPFVGSVLGFEERDA